MNTTINLLDKYREVCKLPSDNQVALRLGVTRGTVSNWRKERNHAEPESVQAMAKACNLDAEEWVLRVQADREIVASRKQVWLRIAQRLTATAASVALATGLAVYTPKAHSHGISDFSHSSRDMYIMSSLKIFLRKLTTRALRILKHRQGLADAQFAPFDSQPMAC